jgi:hypothetical protein
MGSDNIGGRRTLRIMVGTVLLTIMLAGSVSAVTQAESQVHVNKLNRLILNNVLNINHDQLYDFETSWLANVGGVKNLDFVIYKISTPLKFTKIINVETDQNWSDIDSYIPYTHTGNDYVWNLSLVNLIGSHINLYINETTQTNPWADLTISKTQEGDNTRLDITVTAITYFKYGDLKIRADQIISYSYPTDVFSTISSQNIIVFRSGTATKLNQPYIFSVLVKNPKNIILWGDNSSKWVVDLPSYAISLPVSGFGSVNVSSNVPVKWSHPSVLPQHAQQIIINVGILSYYRSLASDPNVVETKDLLIAADDWNNNIIPPGFTSPVTTQQLLMLADEWLKGG